MRPDTYRQAKFTAALVRCDTSRPAATQREISEISQKVLSETGTLALKIQQFVLVKLSSKTINTELY